MLAYRCCPRGFAAPHAARLGPRLLLRPLAVSWCFYSTTSVRRDWNRGRTLVPQLKTDTGPLLDYNTPDKHWQRGGPLDPYLVAQEVRALLRKDSFTRAFDVARKASTKSTKMVVSWNHLIQYELNKGNIKKALELYNEMKKRAQVPNLATFTIIFSGCAKSLHPSKAVTEATRIYNRMLQEESGYRLNTIHMNAVLSVCARAGDMTALFETLATANGRDRVPDSATYSTVFNGLRHRAERDSEGSGGLVDAHAQRKIEDRIEAAMKIWADARKEWKRGALVLDEAAVSALCRLLTTGGYRENDTVLEVLEEFMRVPRLDRPNMSVPTTPPPITTPPPLPARGTLRRPTKEIHYPAPSVKTLSTVLTALANTRKTGCAPKYWTYFTKILGLVPDTDNHICLLRAYEVGHASARAADLIETMPKHLLAPSTFRRAMVVCKKDNLYQDAFQHARRILAVMCATQRLPDEIAMRLFLQVARGNTAQFFEGAEGRKGKREAEEKQQASPAPAPGDGSSPVPTPGQQAYARQLATAIDDLWDPFHRLASSLSYPEGPTKSPAEQLAAQEDVMAQLTGSARRMMTVLDRAVEYTLPTDTDTLRQLRSRRAVLQRQVERWITKLYPQGEPPMSKALGEKSEARVDERRENRKRQLQWERSVARRPVSSSV